ncbi:TRAM domain-containing protein, partial [Mycobacterium tuberculosis]|nr:TRAM domain-containing protein [Mycobacterium tuberculosis]
AFSFKHSPRPGTPAATSPEQIAESVKTDRLHRLQQGIDAQAAAFLASRVGLTFDVLFEKPGRRAGQIVGRSPWLQPVHVQADAALIGRLAAVTMTAAQSNSLYGTLAAPAQ